MHKTSTEYPHVLTHDLPSGKTRTFGPESIAL